MPSYGENGDRLGPTPDWASQYNLSLFNFFNHPHSFRRIERWHRCNPLPLGSRGSLPLEIGHENVTGCRPRLLGGCCRLSRHARCRDNRRRAGLPLSKLLGNGRGSGSTHCPGWPYRPRVGNVHKLLRLERRACRFHAEQFRFTWVRLLTRGLDEVGSVRSGWNGQHGDTRDVFLHGPGNSGVGQGRFPERLDNRMVSVRLD